MIKNELKNKDRRNFCWMNPNLAVRDTKKYGNGVFAIKKIKRGELCAVFGGYVISYKDEAKLPSKYNDTGIQISDQFVISTLYNKEPADNLNHSCNPNTGVKGQIFLVSMRKIEIGEQVTFDYAMCLSYTKKYSPHFYKTKCLCGSKNCRGLITANDWKRPELQKRYKSFFSWYIQEKINKLNSNKK